MGLDPMLQQRSVAQVFVPLAEDILVLLKQLSELLLLKWGEVLWQWRLARRRSRLRRGGRSRSRCFCEVDHFESAYTLPCMELERLGPVVVYGIP